MKTMHKQLTTFTLGAIGVAAVIGIAPIAVNAQVLVNTANFSYSQNFNSLPSSGDSNAWTNNPSGALLGWYSSVNTYRTTNNGTAGFYSFGNTTSDRALGSLASAGTGNIFYGLRLRNSTTQTITSLAVNYVGEQWYRNNTADTLSFSYQLRAATGATDLTSGTWVAGPTTLNFTNPQSGNPAATLDGNLTANRTSSSGTITGLSWGAGTDLWIRWQDTNQTGSDQGLAIDDVTVSVPEPTTILGGMAALGIGRAVQRKWQRGKKKTAAAKA